MSGETTAELAVAVADWFERLWPDRDRGDAASTALLARFGGDRRPVDARVCAEIEQLVHDHSVHFALTLEGNSANPDTESLGWPPPQVHKIQARAGNVRHVLREAGNVAVIKIDGFDPIEYSLPYLEAAFARTRDANGLVLDLRDNGGGDPATITYIIDWILGPQPTEISTVHFRDRTARWATPGRAVESALPAGTPIAVVMSQRTFSSAEAVVYHLQQLRDVVVVGEQTRGGADHITPVRVTRSVTAFIPEAYVVDATSGSNWERVGIAPTIPCAEESAVAAAIGAVRS